MNRQMKRMMQRQGQAGADGAPASPPARPPGGRPPGGRPPGGRPPGGGGSRGPRQSPGEFFGDVRTELKKVAWPTGREVVNYSTIVLFTLVLLIGLIFLLDLLFSKAIFLLFDT